MNILPSSPFPLLTRRKLKDPCSKARNHHWLCILSGSSSSSRSHRSSLLCGNIYSSASPETLSWNHSSTQPLRPKSEEPLPPSELCVSSIFLRMLGIVLFPFPILSLYTRRDSCFRWKHMSINTEAEHFLKIRWLKWNKTGKYQYWFKLEQLCVHFSKMKLYSRQSTFQKEHTFPSLPIKT